MSLQLVANHLAQKGRGPDSTLVHMSNREVAGLNALAQKHGGQLSVNPDTGLPEAGFLDSILPAVAGFGLSAVTGIDPITSAAIVGGITALDSKDLSKGLVAGLGAFGGAGMAGGLATLGGAESLATATPAQYGAGYDAFTKAPIDSLSTLGGGSVLKGSLPILAGLAPAAAEAFDEEDEDKPPEQKKGYIRKYAFDPVTGQYKQVGAYEAGGDPNKDVSAEAGTAGSYGGVGQSEYEAAQGMAEGGTATDSSRIYDYLMGRGPNPMQFTHTTSPQVDYNIPKPPEPITPTTPILDPQYDQYGNAINRTSGGGGNDSAERREQREADLGAKSDYLSAPGKKVTMRDYWAMDSQARKNLNDAAAIRNPMRGALAELGKPIFARVLTGLQSIFPKPVDLNQEFAPLKYDLAGNVIRDSSGYPITDALGFSAAPTDGGAPPSGTSSGAGAFPGGSGAPPSGEGSPMGSGAAPTDGGAPPSGGGGREGQHAPSPTSSYGDAKSDIRGGGFNDARGGYLQHGQFDQRMAHGGISGHLRPPQQFYANGKFGYKGPQVYAHGGISALAQGYDDGGMALSMRAQPIKNLGSMHPKSLQAAYDHAVATNDVAGARKYQNELGLREKFKSPQIYADGGETGEYNLGGYSDGGRLLKGPGDGVSDDIPATIGHGQPARLADGEFVIPARIVSELGNGSTDAGARELYKMMDRIQAGRRKTVGKDQVAKNSKSARHLPA